MLHVKISGSLESVPVVKQVTPLASTAKPLSPTCALHAHTVCLHTSRLLLGVLLTHLSSFLHPAELHNYLSNKKHQWNLEANLMLVLWVQFSFCLCNYISLHMRSDARGSPLHWKKGPCSCAPRCRRVPRVSQPCLAPAPALQQAAHCLGAGGGSVGLDQTFTAKQLTAAHRTARRRHRAVPAGSVGHCWAPLTSLGAPCPCLPPDQH